MQIWAESGKSALPICNYSQILYQFLTFTQNLKRSRAFTAIVNSLVTDIFTPLLSLLGGGTQMESLGITFGIGEHAATLAYGSFLSAVINFLITAFAIFCLVKAINTVQDKIAKKPEEEKKEPTTKKCPFCQSEIDIRAIRCPFCTSELEK